MYVPNLQQQYVPGQEEAVSPLLPLSRRGVSPAEIYLAEPIFKSLARRSIVVSHRDIIDSEYNLRHCEGAERRAYDTLDGLVEAVEAAVKSGDDAKFVYAYWPEYDAISHRYGSQSTEAFDRESPDRECWAINSQRRYDRVYT